MIALIAVKVVGAFALALGMLHFFFPKLLDFENVVMMKGPELKPFKLLYWSYQTKRADVRGIIWLMNHHVSFVIVSIGIADLLIGQWISNSLSSVILLWMSAWWFLRALLQFYLGTRQGDWLVFGWFLLVAFLQGAPTFL
jgi:hypothetical protein